MKEVVEVNSTMRQMWEHKGCLVVADEARRSDGLVYGTRKHSSVFPDGLQVEILPSLGTTDTPSLALIAPNCISARSPAHGGE